MNDAQWYYMRDNHTFRKLTGDEKDFKIALMEEFLQGHTHGMLCTKTPLYENLQVHSTGSSEWEQFWVEVQEVINTQAIAPEPETVEVDLQKLIIQSLQELNIRLQKLEQHFKDDGK